MKYQAAVWNRKYYFEISAFLPIEWGKSGVGKFNFCFHMNFPRLKFLLQNWKRQSFQHIYISLFRTLSYITLCIHTMIAIPSAVSTRKGQLFKVRFKIFVYIFLIQSYPFIWQQVGKGWKNIIFCSHINQSQITYKH